MTRYTFGDGEVARERLRLLARAYDPPTEELLVSFGPQGVPHAVDLGCGPGHSTRLLHRILSPDATTGLDISTHYIAQATAEAPPGVRFALHDVTRAPFPVPPADVLLCRYLLAHLESTQDALHAWAVAASPGAVLFVLETETLASGAPALSRYYELLRELQRRYGQALDVGGRIDAAIRRTPWHVQMSRVRFLSPDPRVMAQLHQMNLRTWRHDRVAVEAFDPAELSRLEVALGAIADGLVEAGPVHHQLREIVAVRGSITPGTLP